MKELAVHCTVYFQYDDEDANEDPEYEAWENFQSLGVEAQIYHAEWRTVYEGGKKYGV